MGDNLSQSKKKVQKNAALLIPAIETSYQQYFNKITELQAGDIIKHVSCKFCNHALRSEGENKWEQTKGRDGRGSLVAVIKFLNNHPDAGQYGVVFTYKNVSDHINHHYEQQVKRLWMRAYGRNLADAMNYKIAKEEMFEGMIQAFQLKLYEIAANPELDLIKQCDMMNKMGKSIGEACLVQAKLRGDIDTASVYMEKVQNIMINFISDQDTDKQKELMERLDIAKASLQE